LVPLEEALKHTQSLLPGKNKTNKEEKETRTKTKKETHPSVIIVLTIVNLIRVSGFELFVCAVVVVVISRRRRRHRVQKYNCLSLFLFLPMR